MLNIIWPIFILISFIYGIFTGKVEQINSNIFESASNAVQFSISLLGVVCLWTGVMKIISKTNLLENLNNFIRPLMKFLFPELKKNTESYDSISMNIVANILGLGNAATPLGLKAMQSLQKENKTKDTLSDSMAMLIVLNTASLQIIPTTVIAIRSSLNSVNPTSIIIPVWIATVVAAITGIVSTKILLKRY